VDRPRQSHQCQRSYEECARKELANIPASIRQIQTRRSTNPVFSAVYDLLKGMAAIRLYYAICPFWQGFATAIAAIFVWVLLLPVPMIGLLPMRFLAISFVAEWAGLALISITVGTLAGAWLYREDQ
jgi:hypothetical protein